jgi:photosynthetic reaction center H subunit
METGALTGYIDVAQVVLYVFWAFFAGLIFYLRREDRREGYPLVSDGPVRSVRPKPKSLFLMPAPKTFRLHGGHTVEAPASRVDDREIRAQRVAPWPGAPSQPTGNPMLDGVGPAAYALREDLPEMTWEGTPNIVPMRVDPTFTMEAREVDPRGMQVIGGDGLVAGVVSDLWVDRAEPQIRYLEVEVPAPAGSRHVLLPIHFAKISRGRRVVNVSAILAGQFADVPGLQSPEQVTKREEDRITAYYAGGTLYATPDRLGPIL